MTLALRRASSPILLGAVGIALIWLVARDVAPGQIWVTLQLLSALEIGLLAAANGAILLILTARWWIFLAAQGHVIPFLTLVGYRLAAAGVSYFTPGPQFGGEPLQIYLLTKRWQVPSAHAVAAVTMDKTTELLANFFFLLVGVLFVVQQPFMAGRLTPRMEGQALLYSLLLLALPALLLWALWTGRRPLSAPLAPIQRRRPTPWLERLLRGAMASEERIQWLCRTKPRAFLAALAVSLLSWAAMVGEFWLATHLLQMNLTFGQVITALVAARIAILLPIPAGLGTIEASQVIALSNFGVGAPAALSLSLLIRTRDVLLGLIGLWIGGRDLWTTATHGEPVHES